MMQLSEPPRVRRRNPTEQPPGRVPVHPILWTVAGLIVVVEGLQQLAGAGLAPPIFDRWEVFGRFAFFDVAFEWAMAGHAVTLQLLWSLFTHAFLHAGWLHLAMNMAVFLALGHAITQAIGPGRMFAAFLICAVTGALAFGLIGETEGPLVGASGAVFGFLGMVTAWQERALAHRGLSRRAIWQRIGGLVAINLILDIALGGLLAWEAHLGGFVAGWLLALLWPPARVRLPF